MIIYVIHQNSNDIALFNCAINKCQLKRDSQIIEFRHPHYKMSVTKVVKNKE